MRRVATIALIVASVASFAGAQRGASHGGFSGRSAPSFHGTAGRPAPAFHGGFTTSGPARFAVPPRYGTLPGSSFTRSPLQHPPTAQSFIRRASGSFHTQPNSANQSHHRMPYRSPYRHDRDSDRGFRYIYPEWPVFFSPYWYTPYFLSYPDSLDYSGDDNASASAAYPLQGSAYQPDSGTGYDTQPANQGPPDLPPWPSYNPPPPVSTPESKSLAPEAAEPVTIVFNDGRPPEQVLNYLITPTILYVLDKQRREIPIDHLDLVATEKANRDAGVDFSLPSPTR